MDRLYMDRLYMDRLYMLVFQAELELEEDEHIDMTNRTNQQSL